MNGLAVIASLSSKIHWLPKKQKGSPSQQMRTFSGGAAKFSIVVLDLPSEARVRSELRLATKKSEIRKAQRLRFKVFFDEGGAVAEGAAALVRRRHLSA